MKTCWERGYNWMIKIDEKSMFKTNKSSKIKVVLQYKSSEGIDEIKDAIPHYIIYLYLYSGTII